MYLPAVITKDVELPRVERLVHLGRGLRLLLLRCCWGGDPSRCQHEHQRQHQQDQGTGTGPPSWSSSSPAAAAARLSAWWRLHSHASCAVCCVWWLGLEGMSFMLQLKPLFHDAQSPCKMAPARNQNDQTDSIGPGHGIDSKSSPRTCSRSSLVDLAWVWGIKKASSKGVSDPGRRIRASPGRAAHSLTASNTMHAHSVLDRARGLANALVERVWDEESGSISIDLRPDLIGWSGGYSPSSSSKDVRPLSIDPPSLTPTRTPPQPGQWRARRPGPAPRRTGP